MAVRAATREDLVPLSEMGCRFLSASPLGRFASCTRLDVQVAIDGLMRQGGIVLVTEAHSVITGLLVGQLTSLWWNHKVVIATELAWWVDPEHRGGPAGIRLLEAFERWAGDAGANVVCLSDMVMDGVDVGALLGRRGYRLIERSHVKEVA